MKTLIVYATKYGATRLCSQKIARALSGGADLAELGRDSIPPLEEYDAVLLGSSVYMGALRKEARRFASQYEKALLGRKLGLFLCCIQDMEQPLKAQLESGVPQSLLAHACAARGLGGTVIFSRLSRPDRFIMNLVAGRRARGTSKDLDTLSDERIVSFVQAVERA